MDIHVSNDAFPFDRTKMSLHYVQKSPSKNLEIILNNLQKNCWPDWGTGIMTA